MYSLVFSSLLENANKAFQSKNIKLALKLYNKSAKRENEKALFKLAMIYYKGSYIKKDLDKSVYFFKKASKLGNKKSIYNLAIIYSRKNNSYHNYKLAYNNFLFLAKHSYPQAQYQVGNYLTYGYIEKDYKMAVKWYEQALKNGYKKASCSLAYMYANGKGVFPNFGKARELSQYGYDNNWSLCIKVYNDFHLWKYDKNRGFFK